MNAKKRKIIFAVVIVVIILVVMFFSQSKSKLVRQLRGPAAGVSAVFTSADKLVVISRANEAYTWDWNDLKKWPTVAKLNAKILCPMAVDKIVYVPNNKPNVIMVMDLKGEKQIRKITLPFGYNCKMVAPSADCSHIAILLTQKDKNKLAFIGPELKLSEMFLVTDKDFDIFQIAISNDGKHIAACGQKEGGGWFSVIDTDSRDAWGKSSIAHNKNFKHYDKLTFSSDSKKLFVSEKVRFIQIYDIESTNLKKTFEIPEYPPVPQKDQIISSIDVSPDGLMLAASTEPVQKLYIWSVETGEKRGESRLPGPVVGDIAFSPASDMIATSILVRSTISVWKTLDAQ
ncbi:MAG: WD40 repeat domain-containing protein [Anaerohalosphaeraceae bacterium]|nr:WD40 repeat domain-containing protein [Anaerohalosphaeraceae bacterium]